MGRVLRPVVATSMAPRLLLLGALVLVLALANALEEHEHKHHPADSGWINHYTRSQNEHEGLESSLPAAPRLGPKEPFRFVDYGNLSVIYEDYEPGENSSNHIRVVSFSDPQDIVPASFRLHFTSHTPVSNSD